jgi:hypothetical protein
VTGDSLNGKIRGAEVYERIIARLSSPTAQPSKKASWERRLFEYASLRRWGAAVLRPYGLGLVAGYGFGCFFFLCCAAIAVAVTVSIAVTVAIAIGWRDAYRLAGVGKIGRDGFGDIAY